MVRDKDMIQRLNLLKSSSTFVLKEVGTAGEAEVLTLPTVPDSSGLYWVSGETTLKSGDKLTSVFRIDTDASGTLLSTYWHVNDHWYSHDDKDVAGVLNMAREAMFPFDWALGGQISGRSQPRACRGSAIHAS